MSCRKPSAGWPTGFNATLTANVCGISSNFTATIVKVLKPADVSVNGQTNWTLCPTQRNFTLPFLVTSSTGGSMKINASAAAISAVTCSIPNASGESWRGLLLIKQGVQAMKPYLNSCGAVGCDKFDPAWQPQKGFVFCCHRSVVHSCCLWPLDMPPCCHARQGRAHCDVLSGCQSWWPPHVGNGPKPSPGYQTCGLSLICS